VTADRLLLLTGDGAILVGDTLTQQTAFDIHVAIGEDVQQKAPKGKSEDKGEKGKWTKEHMNYLL